ncbi:MAG: serine protease [Bdellovibrionota bacterium]|nr:MAG: serine protease [Bdellovibrionota bacterium]
MLTVSPPRALSLLGTPGSSYPSTIPQTAFESLPRNSQIARLGQCVVKIVSECNGRVHYGSGVVINDAGHVITAAHVLRPHIAGQWTSPHALLSTDAGTENLPLRPIRISEPGDLALVALPTGRRYRAISFETREIESGEPVFSIGFPNGEKCLTVGRLILPSRNAHIVDTFTAFRRRSDPLNYRSCVVRDDIIGSDVQNGNVVSTNDCGHGSSGGAVLSKDGRLIGLVVAFKPNAQAIASDLRHIAGVELQNFSFPERLTISRSNQQVRTHLDLD